MMRQAIRTSEAYFNSDRMVIEYYNRLYKPIAHNDSSSGEKKKEMNISETPTFDAWTFANIKQLIKIKYNHRKAQLLY